MKKSKFIIVILPILLAFLISHYCFQFMIIQGNSMYPTYHNMQFAIINKLTNNYNAGTVVAFRCQSLRSTLVKRIVAVPGNTVQIKEGKLYIDNLPSSIIDSNIYISYSGILADEITLKSNQYIMLGDNIDVSKDSRYENIGIINESDIIGTVIVPFSQ